MIKSSKLNKLVSVSMVFCVLFLAGCGKDEEELTETTDVTSKFTDENFKRAVREAVGKNQSDQIFYGDVSSMTRLNVPNKNITTLAGIEYFTALTELWCEENQLKTIDVSKNAALAYLSCANNQITNLDVSNNIKLEGLDCRNNNLTLLDVSKNTKLNEINVTYNYFASADKIIGLDETKPDLNFKFDPQKTAK